MIKNSYSAKKKQGKREKTTSPVITAEQTRRERSMVILGEAFVLTKPQKSLR